MRERGDDEIVASEVAHGVELVALGVGEAGGVEARDQEILGQFGREQEGSVAVAILDLFGVAGRCVLRIEDTVERMAVAKVAHIRVGLLADVDGEDVEH